MKKACIFSFKMVFVCVFLLIGLCFSYSNNNLVFADTQAPDTEEFLIGYERILVESGYENGVEGAINHCIELCLARLNDKTLDIKKKQDYEYLLKQFLSHKEEYKIVKGRIKILADTN
ncbi:MAG: hypothetical protein LBU60_02715 [Clostridiales bacterium]|jgi:hypothetical protein|nr:hypothetical protein [Clostridiales bacterium]